MIPVFRTQGDGESVAGNGSPTAELTSAARTLEPRPAPERNPVRLRS